MKQNYTYTIFIVCLILSACKKLDFDRLNKIKTGSLQTLNNQFVLTGTIIDKSEDKIVKYGHCWSKSENPTLENSKFTEFTNLNLGIEFTSYLFDIELNELYYYRTYCITENDTFYFDRKSFLIGQNDLLNTQISINSISFNNSTSVKTLSHFHAFKQFKKQQNGICWSNSNNQPSITNSSFTVNYGLKEDVFEDLAVGLTKNTSYTFRSYLKLSNDFIIYSNPVSYTIPDLSVSTEGYNVINNTATLEGKILNLGSEPILKHGFCWSNTTSNPNFNDEIIDFGSIETTDVFSTTLSLTPNRTYYFRAFAQSGNELKYGVIYKIEF